MTIADVQANLKNYLDAQAPFRETFDKSQAEFYAALREILGAMEKIDEMFLEFIGPIHS